MTTAGMARHFAALVVIPLVLSGCSSNKTQLTDYQLYSEADARLNLDLTERPLSVVMNVYQLKDRQTFARLTFEDFVSGKTDAELFGEDLVSKSEFVVLPGSKQFIDAKLAPDAHFIGIVAAYRMPADQQWRYLIPAEQMRKKGFWSAKKKTVSIVLRNCYMTVNGVDIDSIPGQRNGGEPSCSSTAVATSAMTVGAINDGSSAREASPADSNPDKTKNLSETTDSALTKARSISETASSAANTAKTVEPLVHP